MVLVRARGGSNLIASLELQQANGAGLSLEGLLVFLLVGEKMRDENGLRGAVMCDGHEDIQVVQGVLGMRAWVFRVQGVQFPPESVQIRLQVEAVQFEL